MSGPLVAAADRVAVVVAAVDVATVADEVTRLLFAQYIPWLGCRSLARY